jgi:hypothetical protein
MNSRRGFLKGVWIAGAAATVALVAKQTQYELSKPEVEDICHLSPEGQVSMMTLSADNRTAEQKKEEASTYSSRISIWQPHATNTVSMSVGKDDRLWIKINDVWKRVAIDA